MLYKQNVPAEAELSKLCSVKSTYILTWCKGVGSWLAVILSANQ